MKPLSRCLRAFRILLFTLGVMALVFSVVSPDDDDIQQEFVQQRSSHCSRIVRIGNARITQPGNRKIASTVLLISFVSLHSEWQASAVAEETASVAIFAAAGGERSPPLS
jgi:hypothetical protein